MDGLGTVKVRESQQRTWSFHQDRDEVEVKKDKKNDGEGNGQRTALYLLPYLPTVSEKVRVNSYSLAFLCIVLKILSFYL